MTRTGSNIGLLNIVLSGGRQRAERKMLIKGILSFLSRAYGSDYAQRPDVPELGQAAALIKNSDHNDRLRQVKETLEAIHLSRNLILGGYDPVETVLNAVIENQWDELEVLHDCRSLIAEYPKQATKLPHLYRLVRRFGAPTNETMKRHLTALRMFDYEMQRDMLQWSSIFPYTHAKAYAHAVHFYPEYFDGLAAVSSALILRGESEALISGEFVPRLIETFKTFPNSTESTVQFITERGADSFAAGHFETQQKNPSALHGGWL